MRSPDTNVLEALGRACASLARRVSKRRQVAVDIHPLSTTAPAACAPRIREAVEVVSAERGLASQHLYSAAGHDAQNLATVADAGMIFIPSKGGRSHRVDEMSDWDAIERGANVLLGTLLRLAA
jgi:N-carbamoyl-L-amino-acid hydrolase